MANFTSAAGHDPCTAVQQNLSILEHHVIPALGSLTCAFLLLSPMKAVSTARLQGALGDLNPLPWVFMTLNGLVYTVYSLMMSPADWYLVGTSAASFLCGGYYTTSAFRLASDKTFRRIEAVTYAFSVALLMLFCLASQLADEATRLAAIGVAGSFINALMYGTPLATLRLVLRERSAATIHLPLVLAATMNTALWTTYGLVINEIFLFVPIGVGFIFNLMLLILKVMLRSHGAKALQSDEHLPLCCALQSHWNRWAGLVRSPLARAPRSGSLAIPEPLHQANVLRTPVSSTQLSSPSPLGQADCCPVCLETMGKPTQDKSRMELSCSHVICIPCATKCSEEGHATCPLCRHPHLLNPSKLVSRKETWRCARKRTCQTKPTFTTHE